MAWMSEWWTQFLVTMYTLGMICYRFYQSRYWYLATHYVDSLIRGQTRVKPVGTRLDSLTPDRMAIDQWISEDLSTVHPKSLGQMCQEAMSGGKRVRSLIIKTLYDAGGDGAGDKLSPSSLISAVLFIEYLHGSSLIIDDMMDGDQTRRGQTCLYKMYGYSQAQMVAIYLLSRGLSHIGNLVRELGDVEVIHELVRVVVSNFQGLCLGQYFDITDSSQTDLGQLHHLKTGTLFDIAFSIGWIIRGGSVDTLPVITDLAGHFGAMFQLSDDFEDQFTDVYSHPRNNSVLERSRSASVQLYNSHVTSYQRLRDQLGITSTTLDLLQKYLSDRVRNYTLESVQ